MARTLSFGWTSPALLAGRKTRTTRDWEPAYARLFSEGDVVEAWDKSPKYGGRRIAALRITRAPYRQLTKDIPDRAYETEGFAFLDEQGWRPLPMALAAGQVPQSKMWRAVFDRWRGASPPKAQWVLEFALVERYTN